MDAAVAPFKTCWIFYRRQRPFVGAVPPYVSRSAEIRVGDAVLVAPGECIAVDGTVRAGHSYVDQATITGESAPAEKSPDAIVYAGTINQTGTLEVVADRIGRDTSFGKIVEAVERAERSRAPIQKTADRYAGYLVYFALACAALTFALTRDPRSTISVIIVAGACGIAAGTPLAVLGAIGRAAQSGAIIKGGRYLEALWSVDTVAFDKTGTVTVGAPEIREVRPTEGISVAGRHRNCRHCRASLRAPARGRDRSCRRRKPFAGRGTRYLRIHAGSWYQRSSQRGSDPGGQSRFCSQPRSFA